MAEYVIEQTTQWVSEYWDGYMRYIIKYHPELYLKFATNIFPPQKIGGGIGITKGAIHSEEDYAEIMNITGDFCRKYENPINFPKEF